MLITQRKELPSASPDETASGIEGDGRGEYGHRSTCISSVVRKDRVYQDGE